MISALLLLACGAGDPAPAAPPPSDPAGAAVEGHPAHGGDHATVSHRFDDPARWSQVFDDPARDAWQRPEALVAALGIAPGATVADVGAGTGYFERHLAAAVGPTGTVIAVDVEPALVEHLRARGAKDGWTRVEARLGTPDDPALRPGEVDLVLLVDTWHHVDGRVDWARRLRAAGKPGARLVIVDFDPASDDDHGPPKAHRLPPEVVEQELAAAGWTVVDRPAVLPHQYVRVAAAAP
jgi:predicted methyltransferase